MSPLVPRRYCTDRMHPDHEHDETGPPANRRINFRNPEAMAVRRKETGGRTTRIAAHIASLYARFLELPLLVVLLTLWLVGVAFIGLSALILYQLFWLILETLAEP
jgi:hypothetical protein